MSESKEIKIGDKTFLILKERNFKAQCDLELAIPTGKTEVPRYEVIKADCRIMDIIRDLKGNMKSKEFRNIIDEDIEALTTEQGDELYNELLNYRFDKELKEASRLKKKIKKTKRGKTNTSK